MEADQSPELTDEELAEKARQERSTLLSACAEERRKAKEAMLARLAQEQPGA